MGITRGTRLHFGHNGVTAKIVAKDTPHLWRVEFAYDMDHICRFLRDNGEINLPFYLRFSLKSKKRYQTVYAKHPGSCQPPTAGLHFNRFLLKKLMKQGVEIRYITLHISGSILPVTSGDVGDIAVGKEWYTVYKNTASAITKAKRQGNRVIAVGTTAMRALESAASRNGSMHACSAWTDLTILPGYQFKAVDGFLTNFHLPGSSHLLLTCAFAGKESTLTAYREARTHGYRFLDFGDAMLIL
jgi:S-adenosylmethionine:tRNA ribosyltransferase-isomerase